MDHITKTLFLPDADAATNVARIVGNRLEPGDVILLHGPVGAGKTHFARSVIQSLLLTPEDVPSPTFTLVQVYETRLGPLWHSDLYRLTSTDEVEELGLTEAFETSICLIEWPERLGALAPHDALLLTLKPGQTLDARTLVLRWHASKWDKKLVEVVA